MMHAFKALGMNNHSTKGGNLEWYPPKNDVPGIWMSESPSAREQYYLCTRDNILIWLDECIFIAEIRGDYQKENGDLTVEDVRLIRKLAAWNRKSKTEFAKECQKAIQSTPVTRENEVDFREFNKAFETMNIVAISKQTDRIKPDFFEKQKAMILNIVDEELKKHNMNFA